MSRIPTHRVAEHPGAFLREQIEEMGLTVARVAEDTGLAAARLREIVRKQQGVNVETGIALGAYFEQSPEFWMNARKTYKLSKDMVENGAGASVRGRAPTSGNGRRHSGD